MNIKYEPIFGDQNFFNGAPDDAVYVRYGRDIFIFNSEINCTAGSLRDIPIIAMRRIIQEPKRWTVEDQKAERLPEIGAGLLHESEGYVNFVGEFDFRWMLRTKEGGLYLAEKFYCSPIETPEERQQREREEWCRKALDSAKISDSMQRYEIKRLGEYIGSIHDALLSGELKIPEVKK